MALLDLRMFVLNKEDLGSSRLQAFSLVNDVYMSVRHTSKTYEHHLVICGEIVMATPVFATVGIIMNSSKFKVCIITEMVYGN